MGEWSPSNFPAWLRDVNRKLGKMSRTVVGAANKADDAQATATGAALTADGKNTVNWEFIAPDMPGSNDGDLWYVLDQTTNAAVGFFRWDATAQQWVAGPLDGSILTNVTAAHIVAGAIDGQVITGVTYRSAATGARVEISGTSIRIYDANNTALATIDAAGGGAGVGNYMTVQGTNQFVRLGSPTTASGRNVGIYTGNLEANKMFATLLYHAGQNADDAAQWPVIQGGATNPTTGKPGTKVTASEFWIPAGGKLTIGPESPYYIDSSGNIVAGTLTVSNINVSARFDGIIRMTTTADLSLTSVGHAFQIGLDNGANLAMDNNEIQARSNGAAASLYINTNGGNIGLGDSTSQVSVPGTINTPFLPIREAAGQVTRSGTIAAGASAQVTITFPSGRFTTTPRLELTPGNSRITVGINTISATSATIDLSNWSSGGTTAAFTIDWRAVQMTASSANG